MRMNHPPAHAPAEPARETPGGERTPAGAEHADADRGARRAAAPPRVLSAAGVASLQRSVGNRAVARLFQAQRSPTGEPGRVTFSQSVRPGGEAPGQPRGPGKFYKGDTLVITATAAGGGSLADFTSRLDLQAAAAFSVIEAGDATRLRWELTATRVGAHSGVARVVSLAGGDARASLPLTMTVVADLQDFQAACAQAQAAIGVRYDGAIGRLNQAAQAYDIAFKRQDAALSEVSAQEKMIEDLAWGAFLAALGGGAGGAAGAFLKARKYAPKDTMPEGAIIDAGKDLVKFAVRSADKLRGGSKPATAGDSTAQPGDPARGGKAGGKAAGAEPFQWLTGFAGDLLREKALMQATLVGLIADSRQARDANTMADLDEDPVAIVNSDKQLVALANELSADSKTYLAKLWHTWLERYAYVVQEHIWGGRDDDITERYVVKDNVGRKIRKKIDAAAAECGESGDAWLATYAPKARAEAEAEAAKKNATEGR
jgi:hypothetical protein